MFNTLLVRRSLVLGSFRPVSLASLRQPQTQTLCTSRLHTSSYVVKMSTLAHSRSRPRSPSPEPIAKRARRDLHQSKEQQHPPRSPSSSSTKHEGESSYDSAPFPSSPPSSVDMAIESTNATTTTSSASVGASQQPRLLVQLDPAHPKAKTPTRGSALAAGYDLYASDDVVIPKSGGRKVVPTGIRLAIPPECYGRVAPRSGLASKHGIDVGAGVIDADYRGLLGVLLFNFGTEDFTINAGDRIAQLVLERVMLAEVEMVESLDETIRGVGGFGSTGGFGKPASS